MTDKELETLLRALESDRVELKESLSDTSKIRQAICAFANDMPNHRAAGVIFVGVRDDGSCTSLSVTDELLRTLADIRDDGQILPLPRVTVEKRILSGCEMAVVLVQPSDYPPVRFNGRIWIRVGTRRATASAEEEQRLNEKRLARDLPYDLQPLSSASVEDLDAVIFERVYLPSAIAPDVIEANDRTLGQQLASLRFIQSLEPGIPTVVGMLATGKEPVSFVPGAYVQFLRIEGEALSDPIADQKDLSGPLPELLRRLDDVIQANIRIPTDIRSGSTEKRYPDYPLDAFQQFLRNAIMHRDYATSNAPVRVTWFRDRVEIQNPGGPFGQVSVDNFGRPGITDYRNPNVAEVMRNLGFVQRFGVGIQIARKALQDNGNPAPEFHVEVNHIQVTLRKRS